MKGYDDRNYINKERILERDDYMCVYCCANATCVDHIIPWSYYHDDSDDNLVASCTICNLIASNKLFDNIQQKKVHILRVKRLWVENRRLAIWSLEELNQNGYVLNTHIKSKAIIVESEEEKHRIIFELRKEGYQVRG